MLTLTSEVGHRFSSSGDLWRGSGSHRHWQGSCKEQDSGRSRLGSEMLRR